MSSPDTVGGGGECRVLFLHGGPGFSAELERRQYGSSLPIHWWDQPHIALNDPHPFVSLVAACESEVRRMSSRIDRPVGLLASSIGARLAVELMHRVPELIGPVTFSGPVLDPRKAFAKLGQHLAHKRSDDALARAAMAAAESDSLESLWTLIGMILAGPPFFDEYFAPGAAAHAGAMSTLADEGRLLHGETFQAVLNDMVRVPVRAAPLRPGQSVQVLIGQRDPYTGERDTESWLEHLPGAVVMQFDAGHFPHLERPLTEPIS